MHAQGQSESSSRIEYINAGAHPAMCLIWQLRAMVCTTTKSCRINSSQVGAARHGTERGRGDVNKPDLNSDTDLVGATGQFAGAVKKAETCCFLGTIECQGMGPPLTPMSQGRSVVVWVCPIHSASFALTYAAPPPPHLPQRQRWVSERCTLPGPSSSKSTKALRAVWGAPLS